MKKLMTILMVATLLSACTGEPVGNDNNDNVAVAVCGNGVVEPGEECDGNPIVAGPSCQDLGFDAGQVACTASCTFYTDKCTVCGDGSAEDQEVCDGSDLQHETCESLGHAGGVLACNANCGGFDESGCTDEPVCGNGVVEAGEECDDGNNSNYDACLYNCRHATCGDGFAQPETEVCDDKDLLHQTCVTLGYDGGTLACQPDCNDFDESGCFMNPTSAVCGNGIVEPGEVCDGTALHDVNGHYWTCEDFDFSGGIIACTDDCLAYDASDCWFWYTPR